MLLLRLERHNRKLPGLDPVQLPTRSDIMKLPHSIVPLQSPQAGNLLLRMLGGMLPWLPNPLKAGGQWHRQSTRALSKRMMTSPCGVVLFKVPPNGVTILLLHRVVPRPWPPPRHIRLLVRLENAASTAPCPATARRPAT